MSDEFHNLANELAAFAAHIEAVARSPVTTGVEVDASRGRLFARRQALSSYADADEYPLVCAVLDAVNAVLRSEEGELEAALRTLRSSAITLQAVLARRG